MFLDSSVETKTVDWTDTDMKAEKHWDSPNLAQHCDHSEEEWRRTSQKPLFKTQQRQVSERLRGRVPVNLSDFTCCSDVKVEQQQITREVEKVEEEV